MSEELASFYSFANFQHCFPRIAAGTHGLELRLGAREEVQIEIRLHGGEPASFVELKGHFFPTDPDTLAPQRAPHVFEVRGASGWPEGTSYGFTGIGGGDVAGGSWSHGYDELSGVLRHELPPLGAGWYSSGVFPQGTGGNAGGPGSWFPQATPLFYFEPGKYVIDFELMPAATLRGRVLADAKSEFLALALVDERGVPIPVGTSDGHGQPVRFADTTARGEFVLRHAPVGSYRLRAGTRSELEQGLFRRELALEIQPGENAPLEIRF